MVSSHSCFWAPRANMSAVWFCTFLLVANSVHARPNLPPGSLVSNFERQPSSRRIDLPKFLQDIQDTVSKAAKDATENAKQHIAAMKQKHMDMVRRQFLEALAPIPLIKERINKFRPYWHLQPNLSHCPDCLPVTYNTDSLKKLPHSVQNNLSPCKGNVFLCLKVFDLPHQPPEHTSSSNNIFPVTKPTVTHDSDYIHPKNTSNDHLAFHKTQYISSSKNSSEAGKFTTESTLPKITLPEKLFNQDLTPTTSIIVDSSNIMDLEDLKTNSTMLEKEILGIDKLVTIPNNSLFEVTPSIQPQNTSKTHETHLQLTTTTGIQEKHSTDFWNYYDNSFSTKKSLNEDDTVTFTSFDTEKEINTEATTFENKTEIEQLNVKNRDETIESNENESTMSTIFEPGNKIKPTESYDDDAKHETTISNASEHADENFYIKITEDSEKAFNAKSDEKYINFEQFNEDTTLENSEKSLTTKYYKITSVGFADEETNNETLSERTLSLNNETATNNFQLVHKDFNNISNEYPEWAISSRYNETINSTFEPSGEDLASTTIGDPERVSETNFKTTTDNFERNGHYFNNANISDSERSIRTKYNENNISHEEFDSTTTLQSAKVFYNSAKTEKQDNQGESEEASLGKDELHVNEEDKSVTDNFEKTSLLSTLSKQDHVTHVNNPNIEETSTECDLKFHSTLGNNVDISEFSPDMPLSTVTALKSDQTFFIIQEKLSNLNAGKNKSFTLHSQNAVTDRIPFETTDFSSIYASENFDSESLLETTEIGENHITKKVSGFRYETTFYDASSVDFPNSLVTTETYDGSFTGVSDRGLKKGINDQEDVVEKPNLTSESTIVSKTNIKDNFGVLNNSNETLSSKEFSERSDFLTDIPDPEALSTDFTTIYNNNFIDVKTEPAYNSENNNNKYTDFEEYFEPSTESIERDIGDISTTDTQTYETIVENNEDEVDKFDVRSFGVISNGSSYQKGVLKFTTELESETVGSPTANGIEPLPVASVVQSFRNLQNKQRLGELLPSAVQTVRHCADLFNCLIPNNQRKRHVRDSNKKYNLTHKLSNSSKFILNNKKSSSGTSDVSLLGILNDESQLSKSKGVNFETSTGFHASTILELVPVVREGYRNNAFNDNDKKIIRSIFGDMTDQIDEETTNKMKEPSGDLLMKDATANAEELLEIEEYDSSEFEELSKEMEKRSKRSKYPFKVMSSTVRIFPNLHSNVKPASTKIKREIRPNHHLSEAAAILSLLAEHSDVQLDAPDDEDDDYYEYYEDEESPDSQEDDSSHFYPDQADDEEDYKEPSFVELINLSKKHSQRKARQRL